MIRLGGMRKNQAFHLCFIYTIQRMAYQYTHLDGQNFPFPFGIKGLGIFRPRFYRVSRQKLIDFPALKDEE